MDNFRGVSIAYILCSLPMPRYALRGPRQSWRGYGVTEPIILLSITSPQNHPSIHHPILPFLFLSVSLISPPPDLSLIRKMSHLTGDPKQHDLSSFKDSLSGSCLCGSITVTIHDNELFTKPRGHLCHCANCRKVSGSVVSANLIMEEDKVDINDRDGTLKIYEDKATNSGNPVYRYFCAVDGK
jgi:hypothetical protein